MKVLLCCALLFCCLPAFGSDKNEKPNCHTTYSVIQDDSLGNVKQGIEPKNLKFVNKELRKKYPDVCYAAPSQSVPTVFVITVSRATYHGTQVISTTNNNSGTVNASDGSTARYSGSTTNSTVVPDVFDYGQFILTVETLGADGKVTVRHRFEQNGIYATMYGIPLGGRGHHPVKALIEDAVKWIHAGGLDDALQSAN